MTLLQQIVGRLQAIAGHLREVYQHMTAAELDYIAEILFQYAKTEAKAQDQDPAIESKASQLLAQARGLAAKASSWADFSNRLFDQRSGLLAKFFPTEAEWRAFCASEEYKEIQQLLLDVMKRTGLVEGATPVDNLDREGGKMADHTPGPWRVDLVDHHFYVSNGIEYIAELLGGRSRSEANACLIAAAPDLLAACKSLTSCLRAAGSNPAFYWAWQSSWRAECEAAVAAIAKAEGSEGGA